MTKPMVPSTTFRFKFLWEPSTITYFLVLHSCLVEGLGPWNQDRQRPLSECWDPVAAPRSGGECGVGSPAELLFFRHEAWVHTKARSLEETAT